MSSLLTWTLYQVEDVLPAQLVNGTNTFHHTNNSTVVKLTVLLHSHPYALDQPTVLASVPRLFVDLTTPTSSARVASVGSNASSEEALARFAAQHPKVVPGGLVATHFARKGRGRRVVVVT